MIWSGVWGYVHLGCSPVVVCAQGNIDQFEFVVGLLTRLEYVDPADVQVCWRITP